LTPFLKENDWCSIELISNLYCCQEFHVQDFLQKEQENNSCSDLVNKKEKTSKSSSMKNLEHPFYLLWVWWWASTLSFGASKFVYYSISNICIKSRVNEENMVAKF
jgi:hypothetical protein